MEEQEGGRPISDDQIVSPLCHSVVAVASPIISIDQALLRVGIEHIQDFNDPKAPSASTGTLDIIVDPSARRQSTFLSFLPPELAQARKQYLRICTGAFVKRIHLDRSQGEVRATGVYFESMDPKQAGQEFFARARKEIILCAGALVSPQILMLR